MTAGIQFNAATRSALEVYELHLLVYTAFSHLSEVALFHMSNKFFDKLYRELIISNL